jgi:hypothetical protein
VARWHINAGTGAAEKRLTRLEFATRLGFTREALLDQLQEHASCPRAVAAQIRTMMRWLDRPEDVSVADLRTVALADAALGLLANSTLMGIIGATALTAPELTAALAALLDPEGPEPVEGPAGVVYL